MDKKKTFITYTTVIVIGLLMSIGVCSSKNILSQPIKGVIRILSDACFLPAVMFCGLGGLVFASNSGFFNMIAFGTQSLFARIFKRPDFLERYADYYEYNKEKTMERAPVGFILLPGIAFLVLAVIFMLIHSKL